MIEAESARRQALAQIQLRWSEARSRDNLQNVHARLRRVRTRRTIAGVAGAAVLVVIGAWLVVGRLDHPAPAIAANDTPGNTPTSAPSERLHFVDGSSVTLLDTEASVRVIQVTQQLIEVELQRGGGQFKVTPSATRRFVVRSGQVTVEVLGTEFEVTRRQSTSHVRVLEGRVEVTWKGGRAVLVAGGEGQFPTATPPGAPASTAPAAGSATPPKPSSPSERFRELAHGKRYTDAYRVLAASPEVAGATPSDLMLAADVARLAGHPGEALPYLRRVVRDHSGSGQAPLAAFTLGRTLAGMGRNGEAMQAFSSVQQLAPRSPLAQDALARQVELAHASGDAATARRLAERYLEAYPSGNRAAAVRAHGRLD